MLHSNYLDRYSTHLSTIDTRHNLFVSGNYRNTISLTNRPISAIAAFYITVFEDNKNLDDMGMPLPAIASIASRGRVPIPPQNNRGRHTTTKAPRVLITTDRVTVQSFECVFSLVSYRFLALSCALYSLGNSDSDVSINIAKIDQ